MENNFQELGESRKYDTFYKITFPLESPLMENIEVLVEWFKQINNYYDDVEKVFIEKQTFSFDKKEEEKMVNPILEYRKVVSIYKPKEDILL